MKELWGTTARLLRQNPILWGPTVGATLGVSGLDQFSSWLFTRILEASMTRNSGLSSGSLSDNFSGALETVLRYFAPIEVILEYLEVCLFIYALAITGRMVEKALCHPKRGTADDQGSPFVRPGRVMWFALKFSACVLVMRLLTMLFWDLPLPSVYQGRHISFVSLNHAISMVLSVGIAWLLSPTAVKLLISAKPASLSPAKVQLARRFSIHVAILTVLLSFAYNLVQPGIAFEATWEWRAEEAVANLVMHAPYAALFVALALLSLRREESTADSVQQRKAIDPASAVPSTSFRA